MKKFTEDTKFSKEAIEFMEFNSIELTKELSNKIGSYFNSLEKKKK